MRKYQTPVDMTGNPIFNLRVENVASLPAAGSAGRLVYLTTDGLIYRDNGTGWESVRITPGPGFKIVGAELRHDISTLPRG